MYFMVEFLGGSQVEQRLLLDGSSPCSGPDGPMILIGNLKK